MMPVWMNKQLLKMKKEDLDKLLSSLKANEIQSIVKNVSLSNLLALARMVNVANKIRLTQNLSETSVLFLLNHLDRKDDLAIINEFSEEKRNYCLNKIDPKIVSEIKELKAKHLKMHPKDIAFKLEDLRPEEREEFFALFTAEELAEFFGYLESSEVSGYMEALSDKKASDVLENMDADDAADVINELEEKDKSLYLKLMSKERKEELEALANYAEDEAASIMDPSFIAVDGDKDVKDAMKILVKRAPDVASISTLFVVVGNKFYGVLDFRKLIVTKSPCLVKTITDVHVKTVDVHDRIEKVIEITDDYDIYALPVLDKEKIVGVITIDDVLARMNTEREEDYNQLAGISGTTDMQTTAKERIKNRLPWLVILCFLDLLVCIVIAMFDNVIEARIALVLFAPAILALSGNVGTQSLAICIRGISANELNTKSKKAKHIVKEARNGFLIGMIMALIAFSLTFLYLRFVLKDASTNDFKIAFIVAFSVLASVTCSSLFGCVTPIVFDNLHIDPAAASGPFITTINDVISIVIYFSLAMLVL